MKRVMNKVRCTYGVRNSEIGTRGHQVVPGRVLDAVLS